MENIDEDIYKKALASGESETSARNKATKEVNEMKVLDKEEWNKRGYTQPYARKLLDVDGKENEETNIYVESSGSKPILDYADKTNDKIIKTTIDRFTIPNLKDVKEFTDGCIKEKQQTTTEILDEATAIVKCADKHKEEVGVQKRPPIEEEIKDTFEKPRRITSLMEKGKEDLEEAYGIPRKKKRWRIGLIGVVACVLLVILASATTSLLSANNQAIQDEYNQQLQSLHNELQQLTQSINDKQSTVDTQNQQIQNLNAQINQITNEKQATTNAQNQEIQELQHQIQDLTTTINDKQTQSGTPKALPMGVLILKPDANGSSHGLTGDYKTVSDGDASTYARSLSDYSAVTSTYSIPNPNHIGVGNITAIELNVLWQTRDGSKGGSVGGVINYYGIIFPVALDTKLILNPQTQQSWTWKDINDIEIGATAYPNNHIGCYGSEFIKISEVALKIFYEVN